MKRSVLFVCTGNSARSQMAEAILRNQAGNSFEVFSGGTNPEPIDQRAIEALAKLGVDTQGLQSKNLSAFQGRQFDFVISLCDKAQLECKQFPHARSQLAWDFPDPKNRGGPNPFGITLNELSERIKMFVLVHTKEEQKNV